MQIDIPGDCPTSVTYALTALHGHVVNVKDHPDDETGRDLVITSAVETDDHSVNLLGHPWRDVYKGADLDSTLILPITDDSVVTIY